jgi:hypothetical protein
MDENKIYKALWKFLLAAITAGLALLAVAAGAAPPPPRWTLQALASWSQPLIASGSALPSVASFSDGDLFMVYDTASGSMYRLTSGAWKPAGGGSGGSGTSDHAALSNLPFASSGHTGFASEAAMAGHVASATDPHGASMTITQRLNVGAGPHDASIQRTATGTITIASYVVIAPDVASPTAPATGTLWVDGAAVVRIYDGAQWLRLLATSTP